jgi:hypothetical protein
MLAIVILVGVELAQTPFLLTPYQVDVYWIPMRVGEEEARVPLADSTRRVSIELGCLDPSATPAAPITFTLGVGGAPLQKIHYTHIGRQTVTLDLPQPASPHRELVITASRVWLPWAYGLRVYCPPATMGVLYAPPREFPQPR